MQGFWDYRTCCYCCVFYPRWMFFVGGTLSFPAFKFWEYTLPETNIAPDKLGHPKRKLVFQPSIFRGELLVSGRVTSKSCLWDRDPWLIETEKMVSWNLNDLHAFRRWWRTRFHVCKYTIDGSYGNMNGFLRIHSSFSDNMTFQFSQRLAVVG